MPTAAPASRLELRQAPAQLAEDRKAQLEHALRLWQRALKAAEQGDKSKLGRPLAALLRLQAFAGSTSEVTATALSLAAWAERHADELRRDATLPTATDTLLATRKFVPADQQVAQARLVCALGKAYQRLDYQAAQQHLTTCVEMATSLTEDSLQREGRAALKRLQVAQDAD